MKKNSEMSWVGWIPPFFLRAFVRVVSRNLGLAKKYGKVSVTAVGMFSESASWFIPHGSPTVLLTVGSISRKQVWADGRYDSREMLHLTASFDHEIVDGAPAARFMKEFSEMVEGGGILEETKTQYMSK